MAHIYRLSTNKEDKLEFLKNVISVTKKSNICEWKVILDMDISYSQVF